MRELKQYMIYIVFKLICIHSLLYRFKGNQYDFTEDWGEQLVGKSQPVICIFDVNFEPLKTSNPIQVIEPGNQWSPGQVTSIYYCICEECSYVRLSIFFLMK